jgi:hypothetical protein
MTRERLVVGSASRAIVHLSTFASGTEAPRESGHLGNRGHADELLVAVARSVMSVQKYEPQ